MRIPSQLRFADEMTDPRISRTRAAVLDAAVDLVVEGGPAALTVDAVVAKSGVAKSTIYRHWPTRDDLMVGVFGHCMPHMETPPADMGFLEAGRGFTRALAAMMAEPNWSRIVPALFMMKAHEPGIAELEGHFKEREDLIAEDLFERGQKEGLLRPDINLDEAIAHLVGPLVFCVLADVALLSEGFADRTFDGFVAAYAPR